MNILLVTAELAVELTHAPEIPSLQGWYWFDCAYNEARSWVPAVARITGAAVFENHLLDAENRLHPSYFDSTRDYEMIVFRGLASEPVKIDEDRALRIRTRPTVFFLFPGCVVTVRAPDSTTVSQLRQPLTEQLERWQRLLLDPRRPFQDWYALLEARAEIRKLEQLCEEQLDALQEWRDERLDTRSRDADQPHRHTAGFTAIADPLLVRISDVVESPP